MRKAMAVAAAILLVCGATVAQDLQRGMRNYSDVVAGRKKLEQLSPAERQEVLLVHRRIQAQRVRSGGSPECTDAAERAKNAASELAGYARRLESCAEGQDFSDDCSTEFRRVKNAHRDYESAVSDVSSRCQ